MKKLRGIVLSGLAILLPTVITVWVLYKLFVFLDSLLRSLIATHLGVDIPGIGVAAIVVIVLLTGLLAGNFIGKKLLNWYNSLLGRIPVLSSVYRTLKQVSEAVLQDSSKGFKKVGLVEFPRRGAYCVGFVTSETLGMEGTGIDGKTMTVFVPTSPNPTSGFMMVVPASDVKVLDMSVEDGIRMVVTAGMVAERDVDPVRAATRAKEAPAREDENVAAGDENPAGDTKGPGTDEH